MLTRRDGSVPTRASLLRVTGEAETFERIAAQYYSPANLGAISRPEFFQRLRAFNPHLRSSGSILASNQLMRIDLSYADVKMSQYSLSETTRDLVRSSARWGGMAPSERRHMVDYAEFNHLLEQLNRFAVTPGTAIYEALHSIGELIIESVGKLEVHYRSAVMTGAPLDKAYYAVRRGFIDEIERLSGPILTKAFTSRPINTLLKISGSLGKQARALWASEGNFGQLKFFEPHLGRLHKLTSKSLKGVHWGYRFDLGIKTIQVLLESPDKRAGRAVININAFAGGVIGNHLAVSILASSTGGVTLVVLVVAATMLGELSGSLLGQWESRQFNFKYEGQDGEIHEVVNGIVIGVCPIP